MKGMFIKDLCIMKLQVRFFILIVILAVMLAANGSGASFFLSYVMFVFSIFTITTISYDEMDNGMMYLLTLPVTRKQYVLEKYLFGIFMIGLSAVISLLLMPAGLMIQKAELNMTELLLVTAMTTGIVLVFLAMAFPVQFKFGSEKGRIMMFILFAVIVLVMVGAEKILGMYGIDLEAGLNQLENVGAGVAAAIPLIFGLLAYGISVMVSLRILEKKEY